MNMCNGVSLISEITCWSEFSWSGSLVIISKNSHWAFLSSHKKVSLSQHRGTVVCSVKVSCPYLYLTQGSSHCESAQTVVFRWAVLTYAWHTVVLVVTESAQTVVLKVGCPYLTLQGSSHCESEQTVVLRWAVLSIPDTTRQESLWVSTDCSVKVGCPYQYLTQGSSHCESAQTVELRWTVLTSR